MTKLTEEEKKEQRLDVLEKTCLDLLEIVNKLMPTINKIMDGMIAQSKSITGQSETLDACITNQENMVAIVADMKAQIVALQTKLKMPTDTDKKTEPTITYIS